MADVGIKKVVLTKDKLSSVSGDYLNYIVRYRIVSEDKNRHSYWSPNYSVLAIALPDTNFDVSKPSTTSNTVNCVWDPPSNLGVQSFDVYLKWTHPTPASTIDWYYAATVYTNTYSAIIKTGFSSLDVAIQVPTFSKERYVPATLCTDSLSLV